MKIPKTFKKLDEHKRLVYAMKKKQDYEKKAEFWTSICRRLANPFKNDFTPAEIDLIDLLLEKEEQ
jgi:hypothetical protein